MSVEPRAVREEGKSYREERRGSDGGKASAYERNERRPSQQSKYGHLLKKANELEKFTTSADNGRKKKKDLGAKKETDLTDDTLGGRGMDNLLDRLRSRFTLSAPATNKSTKTPLKPHLLGQRNRTASRHGGLVGRFSATAERPASPASSITDSLRPPSISGKYSGSGHSSTSSPMLYPDSVSLASSLDDSLSQLGISSPYSELMLPSSPLHDRFQLTTEGRYAALARWVYRIWRKKSRGSRLAREYFAHWIKVIQLRKLGRAVANVARKRAIRAIPTRVASKRDAVRRLPELEKFLRQGADRGGPSINPPIASRSFKAKLLRQVGKSEAAELLLYRSSEVDTGDVKGALLDESFEVIDASREAPSILEMLAKTPDRMIHKTFVEKRLAKGNDAEYSLIGTVLNYAQFDRNLMESTEKIFPITRKLHAVRSRRLEVAQAAGLSTEIPRVEEQLAMVREKLKRWSRTTAASLQREREQEEKENASGSDLSYSDDGDD